MSWGLLQGQVGGGILQTAYSVHVGADGTVGPTQQIPSGFVPYAADHAGDQILAAPGWQAFPVPIMSVVVRPAGGGADQPAPSPYGLLATAMPLGRAAALVWNTSPTGSGPTLTLSVWRP